jgi:hypothetical protein
MADKVAAEVCEQEFKRLCAARRIDDDVASMTEPERKAFEARKRPLMRAMARKELVISPEGNPVFTPQGGTAITFYKATGASLMAGDGYADGQDVHRLVAVATEITKSAPGALSKLELEDFRTVSDIANFLLTR